MTTLISHHKSMSLDLCKSPIQVFDGENKIQNARPIRKQQTKCRGTCSRSFAQTIYFLKKESLMLVGELF